MKPETKKGRIMKHWIFAFAIMLAASFGTVAGAEVRFGKNVRVGGHNFSNQTFNSKRRAEIYFYKGNPGNEGCVGRKGNNGDRVKVCHFQTKSKARKK
ncbi:hypothetical protein U2P60_18495 [Brucella sp. H1_1004]|uniref:hypothetical protein n=1 Tax=Brucella sp. H1_1004 TaxID=3110109 RepID=UPI0039B544C6